MLTKTVCKDKYGIAVDCTKDGESYYIHDEVEVFNECKEIVIF